MLSDTKSRNWQTGILPCLPPTGISTPAHPSSVTPAVTLEPNKEDCCSNFSFSSAFSAFWDLSQTFISYINSNFIGN